MPKNITKMNEKELKLIVNQTSPVIESVEFIPEECVHKFGAACDDL